MVQTMRREIRVSHAGTPDTDMRLCILPQARSIYGQIAKLVLIPIRFHARFFAGDGFLHAAETVSPRRRRVCLPGMVHRA